MRAWRVVGMIVVAVGCSCSAETGPVPVVDVAPKEPVQIDSVEVVRGVPSRGRDPAVLAIDVAGEGLCTGALIAPSVVLTARHCVARTEDKVDCPAQGAHVHGDREAASLRVFAGDEVSSARLLARGAELVVPPLRTLCGADVAFLILDQPAAGVEPLPIAERAVARGDHVRAVGFGRAGSGDPAGIKLYREHVRVLETTDAEFLVGEATCQGDSGGPALDEATGAVVGLVSRGGPSCEGPDVHNVYTRVDAFRALMASALAMADARRAPAEKPPARPKAKKPVSEVGSACASAADCATGVCVTEGENQYCSRKCGTGDRCPSGYRCTRPASGEAVCLRR